jgi:hypothetical protein
MTVGASAIGGVDSRWSDEGVLFGGIFIFAIIYANYTIRVV